MKKLTLGEWGKQLPVGFLDGDKFNREFALRDLNFGVEREIQKGRPKESSRTLGSDTGYILSKLLTSLGGQKLDPDKPAEAQALLAKCWLADVMYMWIWARYMSCGDDLEIPFPCPYCDRVEDPPAKYGMKGFDVNTAEKVDELSHAYALKTPIEVRGQLVSVLRLQPPTWSIYMTASADDGEQDARVLTSIICGTDKHESILLTDAEINRLRRPDYVGIKSWADKLTFGPKLLIEHECSSPQCKKTGKLLLNWSYDSFFS